MSLFRVMTSGIVLCMLGVSSAQAVPIIGGSSILTETTSNQLETWLGQGDIQLTKIFDKSINGASANHWHHIVNGKGATFTVMTLTNGFVIGGYYDQSWLSINQYNIQDHSENDSFIFSLTGGIKAEHNRFYHEVYDNQSYGATWGGGHDLYSNSSLSYGYANIGHGYGDTSRYGQTAYRNEFSGSVSFNIDKYETFTVSAAQVSEPATLALLGLGLAGLGFARRQKKS